MRVLTARAIVAPDHTLTLQIPEDIPAGPRTVVVVLEDSGEIRQERVALKFNPHPAGPADPICTYRREEMYGDDGR